METNYVICYRGLDGNGNLYVGIIKLVSRLIAAMPYVERANAERDLQTLPYADAQHARGEVVLMRSMAEHWLEFGE